MVKWSEFTAIDAETVSNFARHVLIVFVSELPGSYIFSASVEKKCLRLNKTLQQMLKVPFTVETEGGVLLSLVHIPAAQSVFQRQTLFRQALTPLLKEGPDTLAICLYGEGVLADEAGIAAYVALLNQQDLPADKQEHHYQPLTQIGFFGVRQPDHLAAIEAIVAGNTLCRQLTMLAPNRLTPEVYREKLRTAAIEHQWEYQAWDQAALREMGAGAFVAVAQGSLPQDAALVKLSYRHPDAKRTLALVGKGICFDTGGHNLKSARYMQGMHQDMNGSAVALGIMTAISQQQLPIHVDCWLALAQNHIGPQAYKQNDIVRALNGTTIEVVHTDAEGRMVLADTLTLASRAQPDVILDFATLTGSMQTALGSRMSGVIANRPALAAAMVVAGDRSGERVVAFPYAEDYDAALESQVADILQCTLDSDADHILAARFLGKFIEADIPWCHVDLSAYTHKDGLGAVSSEVNGFGVALGLQWLHTYLQSPSTFDV
ncbi:MAG TPA: leucyl aminopeptidase family protein [Methylophilus sp.]